MRERNQTDDTFIVSAQSPEQRELIQKLSTKKAVFVDGGYNVWLRNKLQTYFVLRGESDSEVQETDNEDDDEGKNWTNKMIENHNNRKGGGGDGVVTHFNPSIEQSISTLFPLINFIWINSCIDI